jgi:hypothetical protein
MKHYAATVQCQWCGHRFSVCVHSPALLASPEGLTVFCPQNASKVHVPAGVLMPVESCPVGAVVVQDEHRWWVRWWKGLRRGSVRE